MNLTVQLITDLGRRLRGKSRDGALMELLDRLGEFAIRAGYRKEGQMVRRAARSIYESMGVPEEPDMSGLGHDDTRQRYAAKEAVATAWTEKQAGRTTMPAHALKPGDEIQGQRGKYVWDLLRPSSPRDRSRGFTMAIPLKDKSGRMSLHPVRDEDEEITVINYRS